MHTLPVQSPDVEAELRHKFFSCAIAGYFTNNPEKMRFALDEYMKVVPEAFNKDSQK